MPAALCWPLRRWPVLREAVFARHDADVLCADLDEGEIVVYENEGTPGDGSSWDDTKYDAGGDVTSVELFDVDGDGDLDFVGAVEEKMVWWKRADGALGASAFVKDAFMVDNDAEEDMTTVVALDIDADGDLDVVAAETNKLTWYENDCTIAPTPAPSPRPSYSPRPTHSFNPTPRPSISFNPTPRPTFRPTNKQFHCESNVFGIPHIIDQPDSSTGYTGAYGCNSIFAIDVDGDFDVDFVAGNGEDNAVAWYANDGYEDFTKSVITDTATNARQVFAIDVDGDGEVDALSASYGDDTIAW